MDAASPTPANTNNGICTSMCAAIPFSSAARMVGMANTPMMIDPASADEALVQSKLSENPLDAVARRVISKNSSQPARAIHYINGCIMLKFSEPIGNDHSAESLQETIEVPRILDPCEAPLHAF